MLGVCNMCFVDCLMVNDFFCFDWIVGVFVIGDFNELSYYEFMVGNGYWMLNIFNFSIDDYLIFVGFYYIDFWGDYGV